MRNPIPAARRSMRWATWWLRWIIESLRRREGSLSFHAEQAGPFAPQALTLAAALGCILTDHLGPAADALERAAVNEELLLVEADDGLPKKSERKGSPR